MPGILWVDNRTSELPCSICRGMVVEYAVPNEVWNAAVRPDGKEHDKEYLCIWCFADKLVEYLNGKLAKKGGF